MWESGSFMSVMLDQHERLLGIIDIKQQTRFFVYQWDFRNLNITMSKITKALHINTGYARYFTSIASLVSGCSYELQRECCIRKYFLRRGWSGFLILIAAGFVGKFNLGWVRVVWFLRVVFLFSYNVQGPRTNDDFPQPRTQQAQDPLVKA